ncbi:DUF559 domain-containing protein [Mycobacterium sp. PS03-16]|nr:DUF559 domain-containing protein [Mycobacterium sp. PS03-16]
MRIAGVTFEQLAVVLHPQPPGAPVVIRYRVPPGLPTTAAVVDAALDRLEQVARALFPAWLPDAELLSSASDHDRRVLRMLAHRRAAHSAHFGPYLAAMADAALCAQPCLSRFDPDTRTRGLVRILADAYGRDALVLLAECPSDLESVDQQRIAAALEWLTQHGGVGVWLAADALADVDRIGTVTLTAPPVATGLSRAGAPGPAADFPAPVGRPHPASAAEQALERALSRCDWAVGRQWNQTRSGHPLVPLIRVDLMWPDERCVVEIDGPDHRGALKYADDRRRDNALTLDGFAVLRFTNEEVADDPVRVLGTIEALLNARRRSSARRQQRGDPRDRGPR